MKMLTVNKERRFNVDSLRQITLKKNDSTSRILFDTIEPILIELQEMMNNDNPSSVYEYLGIGFEEDERASIEKKDPELIKKL
jgi:hypothetical protein